MERRRRGLKWLNFLYSFFGLEIVVKGGLAIGTLQTIIESTHLDQPESLFSGANIVSFCSFALIFVECVFKFLACLNSSKKEGYSLMLWSLVLGLLSGVFYVFFDQGLLVGLVFTVLSGGLFAINFTYVRNRQWCYGNPDLM